jgi:branched-subunit amino acid transport protein
MIYKYIFVMAGITYLVRMLPFALVRKKINNVYVKSFLHYVPYAVLGAMTFPSVFYSTGNVFSAIVGVSVALIFAFFNKSLLTVALVSSLSAYLVNLLA